MSQRSGNPKIQLADNSNKNLLTQICLSAGLGAFAFIAVWTACAMIWLNSQAIQGLNQEADQQIQEISSALAPIIWRLDEKSIQAILDTKTRNPEFSSITVKDTSIGQVWLSPQEAVSPNAKQVTRTSPIEYNGKNIAQLTLVLNLQTRSAQTSQIITMLIITQIMLFFALFAAIALAWRKAGPSLST